MDTDDMRRKRGESRIPRLLLIVASLALAIIGYQSRGNGEPSRVIAVQPRPAEPRIQKDPAGARAAFLAAYKVFMHPRCMNCHPAGDAPLQGDDSHAHAQNVKRGPDGKGKYALKCANCHQEKNVSGENMPPGSPKWQLPRPETPMVFQGKTAGELARQLKDPKQNGNRTLQEILHHVSADPLVLGAWNPGDGRTKPPLTPAEFSRKMHEWVEKGADAPP